MFDSISPYLAGRAKGMLAIFIVAVGGLFGYSLHQHSVVNRLSTENSQIVSLLKDTRAQMLTLSSKIDSMSPQPAAQQPNPGAEAPAPVAPKPSAQRPVKSKKHHSHGDPRFRRIQSQL